MHHIDPAGDHGARPLRVAHNIDRAELSSLDYAEGAAVALDWYNDRLQLIAFDGRSDDPALHIRLNQDGTIAEILVRDDLLPHVHSERFHESEWQKERDRE